MRRALKVRSWERAQQIVRDIEERGESGERITIDQACSAFVDDAKARGLRPQSVYKYELIFRRLKAFAQQEGIEFINECSLEFLRKFRATWNHRNYAIRNKTENLRALFRFAYDAKWIKDNPSKNLKSPQTLDAPTVPFTREEMDRILTTCESYKGPNADTLKAFALLLRHSGLRIRDAVLLTRSRVTEGRVFLYSAKTGVPVRLPLPPECLQALELLPKNGDRYFWSGQGNVKTRVGNFQAMLQSVFKSAGIVKGHAHRFRDTFAIELLLAGVPIERVAVLLGHRSVKTAVSYYSPWVAARQEQLEADVRKTWTQSYGQNNVQEQTSDQKHA